MRVTVFGATGAVGQHLVQALIAKGDTVTAFMARTFLHRAYDEMIQMSTANTTSDLDWTIVRFMAPGTGQHEAFDESGSSDTTRSALPSLAPTSANSPPTRCTTTPTSKPHPPSATSRLNGRECLMNQRSIGHGLD